MKEILNRCKLHKIPELEDEDIHEDFEIHHVENGITITGEMTITFDSQDDEITENFGLGNQTFKIGTTHSNIEVEVESVVMYDEEGEEVETLTFAHWNQIAEFIQNQFN